jgi:hypothetical protein
VGDAAETFTSGKELHADDAGLMFYTCADLELGARLLKQHPTRFRLMMHRGKMSPDGAVANKCKTEAVVYPQAGYTPTPTDRLLVHRHVRAAVGQPGSSDLQCSPFVYHSIDISLRAFFSRASH